MMRTEALRVVRTDIGTGTRTLIIGVLGCAVLTALGAQVRIPLPGTPVPLTLQTFFVPFAGAALGPGLGALSQALYLCAGLLGFPVLAGGLSGPSVLFGATAGYLLGFPVAAWATGALLRRPRPGLGQAMLAVVAGTALIYMCGAGWLVFGLHLSAAQAIQAGVLPFLPGDALKVIAAAGLIRAARRDGA
jgi:biotin transport system substrate-specific component